MWNGIGWYGFIGPITSTTDISLDSDEPVQPPFKLRNFKLCSVSSLTLIEYSCD